jgi:hypothetical protein
MGKSEYKVGGYTLPHYSVLMELCKSELPEDLNFCLESMLMQSYPPTDLVLVCREGLSCALKIIVKSFQNEFKDIIQIVTAGKDVSVGEALNLCLPLLELALIGSFELPPDSRIVLVPYLAAQRVGKKLVESLQLGQAHLEVHIRHIAMLKVNLGLISLALRVSGLCVQHCRSHHYEQNSQNPFHTALLFPKNRARAETPARIENLDTDNYALCLIAA